MKLCTRHPQLRMSSPTRPQRVSICWGPRTELSVPHNKLSKLYSLRNHPILRNIVKQNAIKEVNGKTRQELEKLRIRNQITLVIEPQMEVVRQTLIRRVEEEEEVMVKQSRSTRCFLGEWWYLLSAAACEL